MIWTGSVYWWLRLGTVESSEDAQKMEFGRLTDVRWQFDDVPSGGGAERVEGAEPPEIGHHEHSRSTGDFTHHRRGLSNLFSERIQPDL